MIGNSEYVARAKNHVNALSTKLSCLNDLSK